MIEKTVLDYLNDNDVLAYMEVPANPPKSFVVIEKTAGSESDHIGSSTIAVQSYGETLYEAATLNERVKSIMSSIVELDEVGGIRLNSNYNFTDTRTKRYRYQAVFLLVHY